jgi:hypothetical protein
MANTAKKINETVIEESAPMQVVKNEAPEVAPVVEPVVPKPEPKPELTLEQRISMVEDLSMMIDKWRKLQDSYRHLQAFKIGVDGMSTQIILRDTSNGTEFKTSNSSVVARILEEIRSILQSKIREVEAQIRFE